MDKDLNENLLVLIDSHALIHRAYHGLPPLTTHDGILVNAVYGFTTSVFKALEDFKPKYIAAAFDMKGPTIRHEEYKEYKAKRPPAPEDLIKQFDIVRQVCKVLNIPVIDKKGYEADDVIGTIVDKISARSLSKDVHSIGATASSNGVSDPLLTSELASKPFKTIIVTGDMDALQLVNGNIEVYSMSRGIKQAEIYDEEKVRDKYGFEPNQLVDYKALRGDPSDNIPGVPGIGEKTATKLIKDFGNIEKMFDFIDRHLEPFDSHPEPFDSHPEPFDGHPEPFDGHSERSEESQGRLREESKKQKRDSSALPQNDTINSRLSNLLKENKKSAFLSKKLATIIKNVPINFNLTDCLVHDYDKKKAEELFKKLGFKSLLSRLPEERKNHQQTALF